MSNKKNLLIIGAGIEQIEAYTQAKKLGLTVIGTDANPDAPAFKYCDYRIIASTRNVKETVDAVIKFNKSIIINGVMTVANDVPLTVASVAEHLNLPSIPIKLAKICSNKYRMKKYLVKRNVATPSYEIVFSKDDLENLLSRWGYPLIIKPVDGRGSRGVVLIRDKDDLKYYEHSKSMSTEDYLLAEKFIEGIQLSTESIIYNGNCYTAAISHRNYDQIEKLKPFIIENGGVIPAKLTDYEEISVYKIIEETAKVIGLENGTIKCDIVMSEDGPSIIEFALRLSGGYLSTDQIPRSRGVNLVKQTIKLSLGEDLDEKELKPKNICSIGIRYFFPEPGRIISIDGFNELDKLDWIVKKQLNLKVDDIISFTKDHTTRAGFVYAIGETYEEAEARAIKASRSVHIRTKPLE